MAILIALIDWMLVGRAFLVLSLTIYILIGGLHKLGLRQMKLRELLWVSLNSYSMFLTLPCLITCAFHLAFSQYEGMIMGC